MRMLNIILLSFLLFFVGARLYSVYIVHSVFFNGFHIHHFYFGTLSLAIGGIIGILSQKNNFLQIASIFIGGGIGLFADEIGLLLNCTTVTRECTYAFPGITDIFTVITALILLAIITTGLIERHISKRHNMLSPDDIARERHEKLVKNEESNY